MSIIQNEISKGRLLTLWQEGRIKILPPKHKQKRNKMTRQIIQGIIALAIIAGAIISFFIDMNAVGAEFLRISGGAIIGFYFGGTAIAGRILGRK